MKARAALVKIRKVARDPGCVEFDPHFWKQIIERQITVQNVMMAVRRADRIQPHDMLPLNEGGESWRVFGKDTQDRILGVGVELVLTKEREWVLVLTAFVKGEQT